MPAGLIHIAKWGVLGIVLITGAGLFFLRGGPAEPGEVAFYYDLSEERLYVARAAQRVPIEGVGGESGDGVRAIVFTCTESCQDEDRQIAYFEKYTPDAKAALEDFDRAREAGEPIPEQVKDRTWITANTLVRLAGETEWHPKSSTQGIRVISSMSEKCPSGQRRRVCDPTE